MSMAYWWCGIIIWANMMSVSENPAELLPWLEWSWPGINPLSAIGLLIFMVQPETSSASATATAAGVVLPKPLNRIGGSSLWMPLKF
jgi:hypothetical protein